MMLCDISAYGATRRHVCPDSCSWPRLHRQSPLGAAMAWVDAGGSVDVRGRLPWAMGARTTTASGEHSVAFRSPQPAARSPQPAAARTSRCRGGGGSGRWASIKNNQARIGFGSGRNGQQLSCLRGRRRLQCPRGRLEGIRQARQARQARPAWPGGAGLARRHCGSDRRAEG